MTATSDGPEAEPPLSRTRLRIGQVLGVAWIGASLTLLAVILSDGLGRDGGLQLSQLALVGVELAIPLFLGIRLVRRPTRRLAMWSGWLGILALYGAVIFAADASVSGQPNPAASAILAGCVAMLVLSITTARLYRSRRQPERPQGQRRP